MGANLVVKFYLFLGLIAMGYASMLPIVFHNASRAIWKKQECLKAVYSVMEQYDIYGQSQ